jgi:hypothetical protein
MISSRKFKPAGIAGIQLVAIKRRQACMLGLVVYSLKPASPTLIPDSKSCAGTTRGPLPQGAVVKTCSMSRRIATPSLQELYFSVSTKAVAVIKIFIKNR